MSAAADVPHGGDRTGRLLLGLAAVAVAFGAADTYVVVLALPEMMTASGLSAEDLQQAAPIISGFMLGYVAMLPLIGRIADLRGRVPVLIGSLIVFALGSLVTASAYDLTSMVTGRVLQGIGGGGLLPATLALVGDLYPPPRRGIPLGVVGAIQEFGNVVGPIYGAVVLAFGTWRDIFWINLAGGLVLAAAIRRLPARTDAPSTRRTGFDPLGILLGAGVLTSLLLLLWRPRRLVEDIDLGLMFVPLVGESRWLTPLSLAGAALTVVLVARCWYARRPLIDLRAWVALLPRIDVIGSALLFAALAGIILAFASADPQVHALSPAGPWLLAGSAVLSIVFWRRNRSATHPLIPSNALTAAPAWGSLVVSFFIGAAVIAAVVDIPIFARLTVFPDSQVEAALVLVRFLVGLPVGALVGGWLTHRLPAGVVTALGMVASTVAFGWMSTWGLDALEHGSATVPLVLGGLGIGLAMAPVNAALLAATPGSDHGVGSALLVVARTVGKLVGISILTTIGLRRYYSTESGLPAPSEVCPDGRTRCPEFTLLLREAGLVQLHTIFIGAAICCLIAGVVALVVFRTAQTRHVQTSVIGVG